MLITITMGTYTQKRPITNTKFITTTTNTNITTSNCDNNNIDFDNHNDYDRYHQ